MNAPARRLILCVAAVSAFALPGCSDDDPAKVKRQDFGFVVQVTDPLGAPIEGLRVAAGSVLPCDVTVDCLDTSAPLSSGETGLPPTATLQLGVEEDSRVTVTIKDRNGGHVRTLHDELLAKGYAFSFVWDGRDDDGTVMPSGVYQMCMVATDIESDAVLYEPDCILASLYTIIDLQSASDAIGHTDAGGRLATTSALPFPYLYGDELTARSAEGTAVGTYSYTDRVSINVVDESSGDAQRFIRTITPGATNQFDLVFDPTSASPETPPARALDPVPVTARAGEDPVQPAWSFGPVYPNPFN